MKSAPPSCASIAFTPAYYQNVNSQVRTTLQPARRSSLYFLRSSIPAASAHHQRCLTLRSSGAPTAGCQAREPGFAILRLAGLPSHRWVPLSSNVRQRNSFISQQLALRPSATSSPASADIRLIRSTTEGGVAQENYVPEPDAFDIKHSYLNWGCASAFGKKTFSFSGVNEVCVSQLRLHRLHACELPNCKQPSSCHIAAGAGQFLAFSAFQHPLQPGLATSAA